MQRLKKWSRAEEKRHADKQWAGVQKYSSRIVPLMLDADQIPQALKDRSQWLVWRYEKRKGDKKPRKVPYYASGERRFGKQGSAKDRDLLATFDSALSAGLRGNYDGVGFALLQGDGFIVIDLDNFINKETGEISERGRNIIAACASYTEYSPSKLGVHIFVLGETKSFKSNDIGVEVFCGAQFLTVTGNHFPGTPKTINPIPPDVLRRLHTTVKGARTKHTPPAAVTPSTSAELARLEGALASLPADDYSAWVETGLAIKGSFGDEGFGAWDRWSSRSSKYPGSDEARAKWETFKPSDITVGTVYEHAKRAGWRAPRGGGARMRSRVPNESDASIGSGSQGEIQSSASPELPPKFSEERLSAEFTRRNGAVLRFVNEWGQWYFWDGRRWTPEQTLWAFDKARAVARDMSSRARSDEDLAPAQREKVASAIASAKTISAIERLARADRVHAMRSDEWDTDPWLLNTPAGIVNLISGELGPHCPDRYMTKITAVGPAGACPTWHNFLDKVLCGDQELQGFLQRFVGYSLTGSTREHALLFLYGLGGNGKSTFVNAIQGALGDYATTAPMETFVESYSDRHPTDLAMLRGARLVGAQEVEEGQRWALARIKQMSGGDPIRARFMRQDYFEYTPQFKLLLSGNHKPAIRHVDEAIRRRFNLVPFTRTITAAERDLTLDKKLRAEWPGILAWAIEGCLDWQKRGGIAPPKSVIDATAAYLEDEDLLRAWFAECCVRQNSVFTPVGELHASYRAWAERSGEKFLGSKRFSQTLEDHGFERGRGDGNRVRGFRGVGLLQQQGRLDVAA